MKGRIININKDRTLFPHKSFFFNQGITCLVGKNGSGKTLLIKEIANNLKENKIPYYYYDAYSEGGKVAKDKLKALKNTERLVELQLASQGQQSIINISNILIDKIGPFISECVKNKSEEAWILLDSIDTGLSVDNIIGVKEFFNTILEDCEENQIVLYLIVSGNSFELVKNEQSIDVITGSRIKFKNYEMFKKVIMRSK